MECFTHSLYISNKELYRNLKDILLKSTDLARQILYTRPMFRTSVSPDGKFLVAIHRPSYNVTNLRDNDWIALLGHTADGKPIDNKINFPAGDISVKDAKWIYEIPNAFPFRGTTYIDSDWAKAKADNPASIALPSPGECSLQQILNKYLDLDTHEKILQDLPPQILYGLAANSTDPDELALLAKNCCRIEFNDNGTPVGLRYIETAEGKYKADIDDFELFETIANNPYLPDSYKDVMVLRPGVQGDSEITGEWNSDNSHVFEYMRSNSYIPWGHFASNMANDEIRYRTDNLSFEDIQGLRHLYYQRVFITLAEKIGIKIPKSRAQYSARELEQLRIQIIEAITKDTEHLATLWGWNFGYDFSASGYRLHASHQMIHQQYAFVPESVNTDDGETMPAYSCGDLIADTIEQYLDATGSDFFSDFLSALKNNKRTDQKDGEQSLVVWEDDNVVLFVPKAQVSQWELQLLVKADSSRGPVGNVLEADISVRESIDRGILTAQKIFAALNAKMVTSIEYSKRIGVQNGQRLLYSFLPKLPWSMGAFSEAQMRFICGHFPEDFAACCRMKLTNIKLI